MQVTSTNYVLSEHKLGISKLCRNAHSKLINSPAKNSDTMPINQILVSEIVVDFVHNNGGNDLFSGSVLATRSRLVELDLFLIALKLKRKLLNSIRSMVNYILIHLLIPSTLLFSLFLR